MALDIFGLEIRWYGLLFAAAFLLGYQIMQWFCVRENRVNHDLDRLLFYLMGGTIIGARLGHCIFYDPGYYLSNPVKILAVWEGGLASHGGGVGVLIGLLLYARKVDESYLWLLDRVVIPATLAAFFIRTGNLFNSEIVGIPSTLPTAVIFERLDLIPRHPAQVYEALSYLSIFGLLMVFYLKTKWATYSGLLTGVFLSLVFSSRFFIELVKEKQEAYSSGLWLSTGQLLSLPFVIAGLVLIVVAFQKYAGKSE
ncbi:prolipoprotein diacylglyceryl transferase [Pseudomonadota bacterium]